jgi:hypothetical protein
MLNSMRSKSYLTSARITSRGCSMPLQRVMTDFGAGHAFGQVPKKLQESYRYGIVMPVSTVRKITGYHGQHMQQQRETMALPSTTPGCRQQTGEIDGCMLPIVTIGKKEGDKRKQKSCIGKRPV